MSKENPDMNVAWKLYASGAGLIVTAALIKYGIITALAVGGGFLILSAVVWALVYYDV